MIPVKFGHKVIEFDIPEENLCFNIKRNAVVLPENAKAEIKRAIENPIGSKRLKELTTKDTSVVILVDDRTRETPQKQILPFVLDELNNAGVREVWARYCEQG